MKGQSDWSRESSNQNQFENLDKLLWDEMLDICACYFPVDFEPDEKDKVTRSDLGLFSTRLSDWSISVAYLKTKKVNALNGALLAGIKSEHSIGRRAHSKTLVELVIEKCNSDSTQVILTYTMRPNLRKSDAPNPILG